MRLVAQIGRKQLLAGGSFEQQESGEQVTGDSAQQVRREGCLKVFEGRFEGGRESILCVVVMAWGLAGWLWPGLGLCTLGMPLSGRRMVAAGVMTVGVT